MYYRRKILLSLLQVFENTLEKIQLQKLLFLFAKMQDKAEYDFVPYKYGCFSFQANADLQTLAKYGLVEATENEWKKRTQENFSTTLKKRDQEILRAIKSLYGKKTTEDLIEITYKKYPYYAIKSKIADKYLDDEALNNIRRQIPENTEKCLYTIGYEGISLENYLNKLIKKDVKVLCDVRKNSLSMKFGFSKSQLKNACEGLGIQFFHLPEVGIESDQRQTLTNQSDYDLLFKKYNETVLPQTIDQQQFIVSLIEQHHRVAITCFEANICQCHRSHLANAITKLPNFQYSMKHI
jgi:uncharacterized protein (DUF488 family)